MKYRVSRYINEIKRVDFDSLHPTIAVLQLASYDFFDTYEEAKIFIIGRVKRKIINLEKEIKTLKSKLPKLEKLTEK